MQLPQFFDKSQEPLRLVAGLLIHSFPLRVPVIKELVFVKI